MWRYDLDVPLVTDPLIGLNTGKPDILAPSRFDDVLARRAEAPAP